MSKQQNVRKIHLSLPALALLLAGCSQFSQPPAPIESGNQRPVAPATAPSTRAPAAPIDNQAVPTPLRSSPVIRPDANDESRPDVAPETHGATHVVAPGETLYRIAHNSGLKYQDVAAWNQLPTDYSIKVGQVLRLTPPESGEAQPEKAVPVVTGQGELKTYPKALKLPYSASAAKGLALLSEGQTAAPTGAKPPVNQSEDNASAPGVGKNGAADASTSEAAAPKWIWPTQGKLLMGFSDTNKGLDIAGKLGQAVVAVADGSVVYSGAGLRGYGKLIIIKHDKTFLTAYAHNSQILVKEGQTVKKGQKIAEMGNTDAERVKLHFEVRRFGKPVDPAQYLDKQS
jgi:lipoprotein NlpD